MSKIDNSQTERGAPVRLQRAAVSWTAVVFRQTLAGRACYLKIELEVITAGSSLNCPNTFVHICLLEAIRCRRYRQAEGRIPE